MDREPAEIAVEGEGLVTVVDDHERAESFEGTGVGDRPAVNGIDGLAGHRGQLDTGTGDAGAEFAGLCGTERHRDFAGHRWFQLAAKQTKGERDWCRREHTVVAQSLQRRVEPLPSRHEFPGQQHGQVAVGVDLGDPRAAIVCRCPSNRSWSGGASDPISR